MSRELLIDGDVLVYQFSHRAQTKARMTSNVWGIYAREDQARAELGSFLAEMEKTLEANAVSIALSDNAHNFRLDVLPSYKFNRQGLERPMLYPILREVLFREYGAVSFPRLEGDDVLGVWATEEQACGAGTTERVMLTIDKDLKTVPGLTYDWTKPELGIVETDERAAHRFFMYQTLCGDATDGYKGCPGVGPVKAEKILAKCDEEEEPYWPSVVETFNKAKLNEEVALMNARCARILQASDYDIATGEITLWTPEEEA